MDFPEETFDIVRSDITMQHINMEKGLPEINKVMKKGGLFLSLEGGISEIYSSDEFVMKINNKVLPKREPPAVTLYF